VIHGSIPKRIELSARIGRRERKIGKEKESKKEEHGEGKKQVEHGERNQEEHTSTVGRKSCKIV
jgi:hypothetical protein